MPYTRYLASHHITCDQADDEADGDDKTHKAGTYLVRVLSGRNARIESSEDFTLPTLIILHILIRRSSALVNAMHAKLCYRGPGSAAILTSTRPDRTRRFRIALLYLLYRRQQERYCLSADLGRGAHADESDNRQIRFHADEIPFLLFHLL